MLNDSKTAAEKIARILRTDKDFIAKIESRFSAVTGKKNALEKIVEENRSRIKDRLLTLGASSEATAREIYNALISKIEADDNIISRALGNLVCSKKEDCNKVLDIARKVMNSQKGFFLKIDKAREFLMNEPPKKILSFLGYDSVQDMLQKEDLLEVYAALRFIEGNEWLNNVFFKQYETLTPADFEEREITLKALSPRWDQAAQTFVAKKHHNISHLKELGLVFVIPIALGISGELLRMLSLVLHYLHEIPFYSEMFRRIAETPTNFSLNFVSLLRGDVFDGRVPEGEKSLWLVVQRYLAKDDENDWRLFYPHINPEAIHWYKAERDLVEIGNKFNHFGTEVGFWHHLDWVGDYFKDEAGVPVLVSFDLVDTVMSLVKEKEMTKYLYHHQEALWNKIFREYFSHDELEKYAKDHLLQGYFEI
ncbi:MAG: hypothetical protein UY26_C0003G0270 [Candidatus Jorgensenbacteria bacterium GW2011_GWA1_48_13]|uniref:Glycosidase related protein n=2 Tax=Candidatus Joergenseniibacteriota TaxID=1752739 RepID=A0A0G1YIL8_9BACT|nr:MAG: hypothetical protein UY26_C0003G0270 [Candidatus Jorgensenbacteria bacterium GW2011_GWA1_48_13]KKU99169.1 MAG: hypothetical protein UY32_C0005G0003 [Candidatus Jorgensenbacteria bacterium GW2011_GWC1_48_8]KKW14842.1 MAG: hypothetical protein UY55_C0003G0058 [Candidatus Jorgensenbacteria bacterium GW2011_GWB1_50_10]